MAAHTTESLTLPVLGMTCASCQHHVEEALRATAGVESARVDLMAHRASVVFDPADGSAGATGGGDSRRRIRCGASARGRRRRDTLNMRATRARICEGVGDAGRGRGGDAAGDAAGNARWAQLDRALMRVLPWLYALPADGLRWFLLALTAVVVAWAGRGIYVSAMRALRHGTTNMNTLVSLGTGVAFAYSAYATLAPAPGRTGLLRCGAADSLDFCCWARALKARAKRRALAALDSLSRLRPVNARRIVDGVETVVPLEEVRPGDSIVVLPGERIPGGRDDS